MPITLQSIKSPISSTWCAGCGNFSILGAIQNAVTQLQIEEENLVVVYGIGCSGNMADFNRVYGFHALHGRGVANAIGIKMANHKLKVIVIAGDGDTYGEGLNHLISAARGNHDITVLVHNNQMYSLTTGQSSPTTEKGTKTKSTPTGLVEWPLNPLALSLSADATYVARAFTAQMANMIHLIKEAITHEGFSLVDILQPCPTFNKVNTYQWFQERVYNLNEKEHDTTDRQAALQKSIGFEKLPYGLFYQDKERLPYHKHLHQLKEKTLVQQWPGLVDLTPATKEFN